MYWVNKKKHCYYSVVIVRDIFGECSIQQSWGGISNKLGGGKTEPCGNNKSALLRIEEIKKKRKARGYILISE